MKPFCLGYISQVMWRLFVTFPRNGAGTCIPHPGPGLPADSTGHSLQLSNFPSTAQWRSCLCCQSRPGKVLLSKTNWRSQFRKFFFMQFWGIITHFSVLVVGSGHYLFASVSSPQNRRCAPREACGWLVM